jgi:hypothetical protein
MFPELRVEEIDCVAAVMREFFAGKHARRAAGLAYV